MNETPLLPQLETMELAYNQLLQDGDIERAQTVLGRINAAKLMLSRQSKAKFN